MEHDKIFQKYNRKFQKYRDALDNIKKNRVNVLIINDISIKCECNNSFSVGEVLVHIDKDENNIYINKIHGQYIKNRTKQLEYKVYNNYIKKNLINDKYFLIK